MFLKYEAFCCSVFLLNFLVFFYFDSWLTVLMQTTGDDKYMASFLWMQLFCVKNLLCFLLIRQFLFLNDQSIFFLKRQNFLFDQLLQVNGTFYCLMISLTHSILDELSVQVTIITGATIGKCFFLFLILIQSNCLCYNVFYTTTTY